MQSILAKQKNPKLTLMPDLTEVMTEVKIPEKKKGRLHYHKTADTISLVTPTQIMVII